MAAALSAAAALLIPRTAAAQEQLIDPDFVAHVPRPAYRAQGPLVVIDEAHLNFHTAAGQYRPFADLLRADGYRVARGTSPFTAESLRGLGILIVANPGSPHGADTTKPALGRAEADAVQRWVARGGSLLLIADHAPFGVAAAPLAERFGVILGRGWVFERANSADGITTQLVFSASNGRLANHPIIRGRNPQEAVTLVKSFTGESVVGPEGSAPLLLLDPDAREAPSRTALDAASAAVIVATGGRVAWDGSLRPVGKRAQGVAFRYGSGRVVVLGEAAMLSAQLIRFRPAIDRPDLRAGMNAPGNDNRRFALNIVHWLSGLIP